MGDETRKRKVPPPPTLEAVALGKALRALIRGAAPDRQMSEWWRERGLPVATRRGIETGARLPSTATLTLIFRVADPGTAAVDEIWRLLRAAATARADRALALRAAS